MYLWLTGHWRRKLGTLTLSQTTLDWRREHTLKTERLHYSLRSTSNEPFLSQVPKSVAGPSTGPKPQDSQALLRDVSTPRWDPSCSPGLFGTGDRQQQQHNSTAATPGGRLQPQRTPQRLLLQFANVLQFSSSSPVFYPYTNEAAAQD